MMKRYQKIIFSSQSENPSASGWGKMLTLPAMVAGAIAGTIFLSAFLALVLIPGSILGVIAWRKLQKRRNFPASEAIDAEYTVIKDPADK